MKDKKNKNKKEVKTDRNKKPHYKKQQSGIYNKKKTAPKSKGKNLESKIEELVVQAEQAEAAVVTPVIEEVEPVVIEQEREPGYESEAEQVTAAEAEVQAEVQAEPAEQAEPEQPVEPQKPIKEKKPREPKKPLSKTAKLLIQAVLAIVFIVLGVVLLLGTNMLVYQPIKAENEVLAEQRLENRMELSALISEVFPSMSVDDELSDVILRALENKKNTLRTESDAVAAEIEAMRTDSTVIAKLLADTGYDTIDFYQIVDDDDTTGMCLAAINHTVSTIQAQLDEMGVAKLKEEIDGYKGTTTTVTREDENGETVTETVTIGGLIPEAQAKKAELQKKYDELKAKLDELDEYLDENGNKITAMYNRIESDGKAYNVFDKMKAINEYVKADPKNNVFMKDTQEKLASFPGESLEEDDILFIMKVESETGIRLQTVNYGQDYQLTTLSNGMALCYEVYSIPYIATYQGMKNLIAYFNQNDDFYASVYTLSIQYNPTNQNVMGNIVILHYYLLEEGAEYVPPVIGEEIIPGIDGIFGDVTDNGKPSTGKQSDYTVDDIKGWLDDDMSFEQVRDKIKSEGYPATELAWILKEEYKTPADMQEFLEEYGEEGVEYDLDYVLDLLECDLNTLMDIYYATDEPEDSTDEEQTTDPEEDTTDPEEDTTQPEEDTTDPEEDTTEPEEDTTEPEEDSTDHQPSNPEDTTSPEEDTTKDDTTEEETTKPLTGKQSDYTAEDIEDMLARGMTLKQVRDRLKRQGYPATELAWILHEEYKTEDEIMMFMLRYGEADNYESLEDVTDFFECSVEELEAIYNS